MKSRQQALALLEQARTVAEQNGDQRGLAEIEWNLSLVARLVDDNYLASHHGEQALIIARELGHPQLMARCLNLLSYVYIGLRQWDTAEVCATEARRLYEATGNLVLAADSQRMVGWAQCFFGRPRDSLVILQETFAFSQQIENLWGETDCAYKLALTWLELGHYGQAIKLARQGVKQARKMSAPGILGLALTIWGIVQRAIMALQPARETLLGVVEKSPEQSIMAGLRDWPTG